MESDIRGVGMSVIRFVEDCELEIVETYDEENDCPDIKIEHFHAGQEFEVGLIEGNESTKDIQFGDGSVAYGVANALFIEV